MADILTALRHVWGELGNVIKAIEQAAADAGQDQEQPAEPEQGGF
jgi:hypothetical protein